MLLSLDSHTIQPEKLVHLGSRKNPLHVFFSEGGLLFHNLLRFLSKWCGKLSIFRHVFFWLVSVFSTFEDNAMSSTKIRRHYKTWNQFYQYLLQWCELVHELLSLQCLASKGSKLSQELLPRIISRYFIFSKSWNAALPIYWKQR